MSYSPYDSWATLVLAWGFIVKGFYYRPSSSPYTGFSHVLPEALDYVAHMDLASWTLSQTNSRRREIDRALELHAFFTCLVSGLLLQNQYLDPQSM